MTWLYALGYAAMAVVGLVVGTAIARRGRPHGERLEETERIAVCVAALAWPVAAMALVGAGLATSWGLVQGAIERRLMQRQAPRLPAEREHPYRDPEGR